MERLLGHFMDQAMNYAVFDQESNYLKRVFRCKKTPMELCKKLRYYQQHIAPQPRIEDFIRHCYKPCEQICPYYVGMDNAYPIVEYGIREFGEVVQCEKLHAILLFQITEGRLPNSLEMLVLAASSQLSHSMSEFNDLAAQFRSVQRNERPVRPPQHPEEQHLDKNRYPSYRLEKKIDQDCCMCQEGLLEQQMIITLPCMHSFHSQSEQCIGIEKWLETSTSCPLCKKQV
jgi:hypothetical protein